MPRLRKPKRSAADLLLHAAAERDRRKAKKAFHSDEDMLEKVTLTQGEFDAWNQIASGRPMRNSGAVLQAIKMKMDQRFSKPAQKVEADGKIQIEIVTLAGPQEPPAPPYVPKSHRDSPDAVEEP